MELDILCACNKFHTKLWENKHKSQEALKNIGFLPNYKGIIIKDGTELYNSFVHHISQDILNHITQRLNMKHQKR